MYNSLSLFIQINNLKLKELTMRKNGQKTMVVENLIKRIIGNYHNDIVCDEDGYLNFEESVYNIAVSIVNDMPPTQMQSAFGQVFETYDDCYSFLYVKIPGLREKMEFYLMDRE